jgi:predicted metal-binding protein
LEEAHGMAGRDSEKAKLCKVAAQCGMIDPKMIDVKDIVLGEWVRWKCKYGCPDYGMWLTCPPYSPTPAETRALLGEYKRAMLFRMKPDKGKMLKALTSLERRIFLEGHRKALAFSGGHCHLCRTCNIRAGNCRKPEIARPSMEACGIDVFATVKKTGRRISILKDRNSEFTYFGMVLID